MSDLNDLNDRIDEADELRAPFPWFGGKSGAAEVIWRRLGADAGTFCEPFLGSAAVFLRRPRAFDGWVTLNDLDGLLVNFWRSVARFPEGTAAAACAPVFEADLHARHLALVMARARLTGRLMADPDYCEPRLAGWWAWGACVWIGSGWCSGEGPWTMEPDEEGVPVLVRFRGDGGKGVNRQLPHLGDGGTGDLEGAARMKWVRGWFERLADAFRGARVACGDWRRVCSVGTLTRNGPAAVLLDPPYSQTAAVYAEDSSSVAHEVRRWCVEHGGHKDLRIVLCGHVGEHEELEALGWTVEAWDKGGGYQGADDRERLWCSPHCLRPERDEDLFAGLGPL